MYKFTCRNADRDVEIERTQRWTLNEYKDDSHGASITRRGERFYPHSFNDKPAVVETGAYDAQFWMKDGIIHRVEGYAEMGQNPRYSEDKWENYWVLGYSFDENAYKANLEKFRRIEAWMNANHICLGETDYSDKVLVFDNHDHMLECLDTMRMPVSVLNDEGIERIEYVDVPELSSKTSMVGLLGIPAVAVLLGFAGKKLADAKARRKQSKSVVAQ